MLEADRLGKYVQSVGFFCCFIVIAKIVNSYITFITVKLPMDWQLMIMVKMRRRRNS